MVQVEPEIEIRFFRHRETGHVFRAQPGSALFSALELNDNLEGPLDDEPAPPVDDHSTVDITWYLNLAQGTKFMLQVGTPFQQELAGDDNFVELQDEHGDPVEHPLQPPPPLPDGVVPGTELNDAGEMRDFAEEARRQIITGMMSAGLSEQEATIQADRQIAAMATVAAGGSTSEQFNAAAPPMAQGTPQEPPDVSTLGQRPEAPPDYQELDMVDLGALLEQRELMDDDRKAKIDDLRGGARKQQMIKYLRDADLQSAEGSA